MSLKNCTHKNFTVPETSRKCFSDRISGVKRRLLPGLIVPVHLVKYALYFGVVDGKLFLPADVFFYGIIKFAEEKRSIL